MRKIASLLPPRVAKPRRRKRGRILCRRRKREREENRSVGVLKRGTRREVGTKKMPRASARGGKGGNC